MKTFKTHGEQLKILQERGLIVFNEEEAIKILQRENYYNLINGYKDLFLEVSLDNEVKLEQYRPEATFEDIYELYCFDRELRSILLEDILKFETNIKTKIAYRFSEVYPEPHSFLDIKNYSDNTNQVKQVLSLVSKLLVIIKNQSDNNSSVKHYLNSYKYVPLWVIVNYFTFGVISKFFFILEPRLKYSITRDFNEQFFQQYKKEKNMTNEDLESILKTVNFYRNICAHEERLYNYKIHRTPKISHLASILGIETHLLEKGNIFTLLAALKMVNTKKDYDKLILRLIELFSKYSTKISSVHFEEILKVMGLDDNWKEKLQ